MERSCSPTIEATHGSVPDSITGKHHILFVDDEPNILKSLKRLFRTEKQYVCHFAEGPASALEILTSTHIKVVVSDHRMPQMEGAEFLARLKKKRPNIVCIMLTGQANLNDVETAVNDGDLFKFVLKPWKDKEFKAIVASALKKYESTVKEKHIAKIAIESEEKLKQDNMILQDSYDERTEQLVNALETARQANSKLLCSLHEVAKSFCTVLELARPDIGIHARRVANTVSQMCEMSGMSVQDRSELEIATLLHDIGQIGLPAYIIERSRHNLSENERTAYETHPVAGAENLKSIKGFDRIATFIFDHHERMNGTGFPRKLKGSDISAQSYMIGIADEYDHLMQRVTSDPGLLFEQTYSTICGMSDLLFPKSIVNSMLTIMEKTRSAGLDKDSFEVWINDLVPGTVIVRNVYTIGGTMLLAADTVLDHRKILRLRSIDMVDSITGTIRVRPGDKPHSSKVD